MLIFIRGKQYDREGLLDEFLRIEEELVKAYLPLVVKICREDYPQLWRRCPQDLLSPGSEGLWYAIRTWKKKHKPKEDFEKFVAYCIKQFVTGENFGTKGGNRNHVNFRGLPASLRASDKEEYDATDSVVAHETDEAEDKAIQG